MLGGRASVVGLHLSSLKKYTSEDTLKICLLPNQEKTRTINLCSGYGDDFKFISREEFGFFIKPTPDINYDRLFQKFCATDQFIFLHDDTILKSPLEAYIDEKLCDYDFVGARDDAVKAGQYNQYSKILFDQKSMADIRIGTWFMAGRASVYSHYDLSVGSPSRLFPVWSNLVHRTTRLRIKGIMASTDGGFNFNIKARKLNLKINQVDPNEDNVAEHFSRVAAGFINRGMHTYVDHPDEVEIWQERLSKLLKNDDFYSFEKDMRFLYGIHENLLKYNVHDDLICTENLRRFSSLAT